MLKSNNLCFLTFIVVFKLATVANADSSFQLSRTSDGEETYISISMQGPNFNHENLLSMQKLMSGDLSDLRSIDQVPASLSKHIPLNLATDQDLVVSINFPAKVLIREGAATSALDFKVYSTETAGIGQLQMQIQSDANNIVIEGSSQNQSCAMRLTQGLIMAVKGTCGALVVSVANGGRVKILQNGKYLAKSVAARLSADDVAQSFKSASTSDSMVLLGDYLQQKGAKLSEAQFKDIASSLSGSSAKVDFFRLATNAVTGISAPTLIAIVEDVTGSSYQVDAVRALKGKSHIRGIELAKIIDDVSGPSYQVEALRELAGVTQYSEGDIHSVFNSISGPSYQIQALQAMGPSAQSISGQETKQILDDVSGPSYQMQALRILVSKVPAQDRSMLNDYVSNEFFGSNAREASDLIMNGH